MQNTLILGWSIENPGKRRHLVVTQGIHAVTVCGARAAGSVTRTRATNGYGASTRACKRCLKTEKRLQADAMASTVRP